jgi:hypothetical protein
MLFPAAAAKLRASGDDDEDRPSKHDKAPSQHPKRGKEEIQAEQDDKPRHHAMVRAIAGFSLGPHFMIVHR